MVAGLGLAGRVGVVARLWVRQADIDEGHVPGVATAERAWMRELEQENRELRRANDIVVPVGVRSSAREGLVGDQVQGGVRRDGAVTVTGRIGSMRGSRSGS